MNKDIKLAILTFIKTAVLIIMVLIIHVSLVAIAVAFEKPVAGYTVYESSDGGKTLTEVYTHYNSDGEDTKLAEYQNKPGYYKKEISGKISGSAETFINIFCLTASLLLSIGVFYQTYWDRGDGDATRSEIEQKTVKTRKGLIIALCGTAPMILSYILLVVSKIFNVLPVALKIFTVLNYHLFPVCEWLIGNNLSAAPIINVILTALVLVPVPLVSAAAYILGTKHEDIKKKVLYKRSEEK